MSDSKKIMKVYLDNAATTPLREEVKEYMIEAINGPYGNPSSTHQFGRTSKGILEGARKYIAESLNCSPMEIVFTAGGTEADNTALNCAVRDLGVTRIITSPLEHHAVLHTAEAVGSCFDVKVELVNLLDKGEIDYNHLESLLKDGEPTLVTLMHANNEVGNFLDLKRVGDMCKTYSAYFHTDTVQTMGHHVLDLQELNIDFLAASAHKFYGPKGVGFMYVNSGLKQAPFINGGSQERGKRGGTENLLGIAGMHKALQLSIESMEEENNRIVALKEYFIGRLKNEMEGVYFNGLSADLDRSLCTVLSVSLPSLPSGGMHLFSLDMNGIAASGGSACSSGSSKGSHVISAIDPENTDPIVRFSIGKNNTQEELDYVMDVLKELQAQQAVTL